MAFGRLLNTVARVGTVLITKHNETRAVVMSVEQYESLAGAEPRLLDGWTAEFDDLLARMQSVEARSGMQDAFAASPEELGRAAVAMAERRPGCRDPRARRGLLQSR